MSKFGVNFAERDSGIRHGHAGLALSRFILLWGCFCGLAYLALHFLVVRL